MVNCKNYTEPGGERTVIGGTLFFGEGAIVENFPGSASKMAAAQEDSSATKLADLVASFNALLAALRDAGILARE